MAGMSKYLQDKILAWLGGTDMPSAPSSIYLGIYTTIPSDDSGTGGVEASFTGYGRQAIPISTITGTDEGFFQNSADITFAETPEGEGFTVRGWPIFDASSSGNLLLWARATPPEQVSGLQQYTVEADELRVAFK